MVYKPGTAAQRSGAGANSPGSSARTYVPGSIAQNRPTTTSKLFKPTGRSSDIQSTDGLYSLAAQNGLKDRADAILARQAGEKTKQIFSGGFISDVFDVLSAFQYGTVGLAQGKSFAEGVRSRSSFTDTLGDKGVPGAILGTVLDIAFDPLTYIAPATILKKVPFATKLLKGAKELAFGKNVTRAIEGTEKTYQAVEGGTRLGKYLASKLVYMQGADPVFRETFERGSKNVAVSTQAISEFGKNVAKLEPATAAKILKKDETGRFFRAPISELQKVLTPQEFEPVANLYTRIDNLSKEAVTLGLLSEDKLDNLGKYIKNAYTEYETGKKGGFFGFGKSGIKGIKSRVEGLTEEQMLAKGQIDNPAYLLFKSAFDLTKDVENAKMLKAVGEKFSTDVAQEGFTKIPEGVKYGQLSGKYIPDHMAEYIKEVVPFEEKGALEKLQSDLVGNFKFFKVIMNPGTHARNIISNKILNYWKLGMNPLDPRVIANDLEAIKEIAKGTGKWIEEAKPHGYNLDTFASAEMRNLLDSPEVTQGFGNKASKTWQTAKKKLGDIYQAEENQAKLSAFIWNRKKGLSPEEAWKAAESATFNYAQVTPFIRKLRESIFGFPFITFTVKATPVALETAVKNPQRITAIQKVKQGIENLSDKEETNRERESEPAWVKNGFFIKLPIKDKEGRSAYFDLTYILPFGDMVSGNFTDRSTNLKTGLPESIPGGFINKSPFLNMVAELGQNRDFYGNKIWQDSDSSEKQLRDLSIYLTKTYAPPPLADQLPGGYNEKGERQQKGVMGAKGASSENQQRTLMQELLRNVGAKIQPIDADIQETYQDWNKKKALQNLLLENGVLNEFNRAYIPKAKED
jgi:hypothetical protein